MWKEEEEMRARLLLLCFETRMHIDDEWISDFLAPEDNLLLLEVAAIVLIN